MMAVNGPSVTVVVCAYTNDRWELMQEALLSVAAQEMLPIELILSIDHNPDLLERARTELPAVVKEFPGNFVIVDNRQDTRLGGARTTAAEIASGEILAFLDDDAQATPTWLSELIAPYQDPGVVAVGGAPLPRYEVPRPGWFPEECNWVFGCAYRGLPETREPVDHLIGANMSIRRSALMSWGGFHSDDHDDMDLCHRTIEKFGIGAVVYEPRAVVYHFVSKQRLTWSYFWHRCFFVNRGKVEAFRGLAEASNLRAELRFVARSLTRGLVTEGRSFLRGDRAAAARYGSLLCAIGLGGLGNLAGRLS
jgi:glycosyltransferase involved in cell wall biosynthesis